MQKNKVWVCFVVRWKMECMVLGLCQANFLDLKRRYITIGNLREEPLTEFNEFVNIIQKIK